MKLMHRNMTLYLSLSALLFLVAGLIIYFSLTTVINEEINEKLFINKKRIHNQLLNNLKPVQLYPVIVVKKLNAPLNRGVVVKDTVLYDPLEGSSELFREVSSVELVDGFYYQIIVRQGILEPHDYIGSIGLSVAFLLAVLFLGSILINRSVNKRLWKPFYHTLEILQQYSIKDEQPVVLNSSNIEEFEQLNASINTLFQKIQSDYSLLKEFTENASHELQTPLTLIMSKTEMLIQEKNLNKEVLSHIRAIYQGVKRMSKLNQGLILLTKIENNQFERTPNIVLSEIIVDQIEMYEDILAQKGLNLSQQLDSSVRKNVNTTLFETLISNLLINAIKYNTPNGNIDLSLTPKGITIANTCNPESGTDQKDLFVRFKKGRSASPSLGLGLSIVQKTGALYGWEMSYRWEKDLFIFEIRF